MVGEQKLRTAAAHQRARWDSDAVYRQNALMGAGVATAWILSYQLHWQMSIGAGFGFVVFTLAPIWLYLLYRGSQTALPLAVAIVALLPAALHLPTLGVVISLAAVLVVSTLTRLRPAKAKQTGRRPGTPITSPPQAAGPQGPGFEPSTASARFPSAADSAEAVAPEPEPARPLEELLADLDAMIGLDSVKQQLREQIAFLKMQRRRAAHGLQAVRDATHLVFYGPAGTGKTETARLLGQIYQSMGLLARGHVIETDRSGLVGEHVGTTALKTNAKIDEALDGVLLIDEAYTLANDYTQDFGHEAIATLLKRMEDDRERLVVIVTGYEEPMRRFLDSNEGLPSRFTRSITFPAYTSAELARITNKLAADRDYELGVDTDALQVDLYDAARVDPTFGNARYARKLVLAAIAAHSLRLEAKQVGREELKLLTVDDLEAAKRTLDAGPGAARQPDTPEDEAPFSFSDFIKAAGAAHFEQLEGGQ